LEVSEGGGDLVRIVLYEDNVGELAGELLRGAFCIVGEVGSPYNCDSFVEVLAMIRSNSTGGAEVTCPGLQCSELRMAKHVLLQLKSKEVQTSELFNVEELRSIDSSTMGPPGWIKTQVEVERLRMKRVVPMRTIHLITLHSPFQVACAHQLVLLTLP